MVAVTVTRLDLSTGEPTLRFSCDEGAAASRPRVWRLTAAQVEATVQAYLARVRAGTNGKPALPFQNEPFASRFDTSQLRLEIDPGRIDGLMNFASWTGQQAAAAYRSSCLEKSGAALSSCVKQAIEIGERALLRRSPDAQSVADRLARFESWLGESTAEQAFAATVQALVLSPRFLYRSELGIDGKLSSYEVAEALSYSLTGGPPDDVLSRLADDDALTATGAIAEQVERLITSAPGQRVVLDFVRQYFRYHQAVDAPKSSPPEGFDAQLLVADTDALVADTISENLRSGLLQRLLTRDDVFASKTTAPIYGVSSPAESSPQRAGPAADRSGILTQPSWLAAFAGMDHNNPIARGLYVFVDMACAPFPDAAIPDVEPLVVQDGENLRRALERHREDPACRACHALTDPMGFAFERFDHFGRRRDQDHGVDVDPSGEILETGDADGAYDGPRDMMQKLSRSVTVQRCFLSRAFEFLVGRAPEGADGCALKRGFEAFSGQGENFVEFSKEVFTAPAFLGRKEDR